jgi:sigma-B regulation protein RsbU (phosphoserine phosphatase)
MKEGSNREDHRMPEVRNKISNSSQEKWHALLQHEFCRMIIDSLPYPFYVVDANDYTIKVANSATSVFGEIKEDTTCYALTHKADRPCGAPDHRCPLVEVKNTKKPVVLEHIHYDKDGNALWMELHGYPIFNDDGDVVQMIEYTLDITDRKHMEDRLRESEEQFRTVVQSAHDAIISIDGNGRVIFWNRAAEKIFGYSAREVTGKPVSIIMPERFRERHNQGIRRIVSTGKSKIIGKKIEVSGLRKDGSEFPLELTLAKWEMNGGLHFTGILRDITERKWAEDELQKANERMRDDLRAAAEVQKSLLPSEHLEIHDVRFASTFEPCEELGGDIFNVVPLDDRLVGLYILDVSGHGVQAALLSVALSHLLSVMTEQSTISTWDDGGNACYYHVQPVDVAMQLNRQFPMENERLQYFSLVYGVLDLETHTFRYISAGHPGLVYLPRDAAATVLDEPAFPIGWFKEPHYTEHVVAMNPGDRLYLYSDGVLGARNPSDEEFGRERLVTVLDQGRGIPIRESISSLLHGVVEWRGGALLEDDVSVLAIEIADQESE